MRAAGAPLRALLTWMAFALPTGTAADDVVVLVNGDRVSGKVTGAVARRVRLQTPYGVLVIPAEKVERIVRDDGTEQVLHEPAPAPARPASVQPATLVLLVTGASFWYAWDPKAAPEDPSLRLELRLDDRVVATYTDVNLDPEDLPRAVVNSFVFSPERLFVSGAEGVTVGPPDLAAGREVRLELRVPQPLAAGERRLRLAYQLNDAGSSAPRWRDVVVAGAQVVLAPGAQTRLKVLQDRGTMDYVKRLLRGLGQMRGVEGFRAGLSLEPEPSAQ
jgi:hypothetical protein